MAVTDLGLLRNAELSFAGSTHYVRVRLRFPSKAAGSCQGCLNTERIAKRIIVEIVEVLTKARKPAGHHTVRSLTPEAKKMFRDGSSLCFECIGQLPCRT